MNFYPEMRAQCLTCKHAVVFTDKRQKHPDSIIRCGAVPSRGGQFGIDYAFHARIGGVCGEDAKLWEEK